MRSKPLVYGAISLGTLLVLWVLSTSVFQWIEPRVLPSPTEVIGKYLQIITEPFSGLTLDGHILESLKRWGMGVFFAMITGIPVGVLFAWAPWFRTLVNPIFQLIHFIPPFRLHTYRGTLVWCLHGHPGYGGFHSRISAFVINAQLGVSQVDKIYTDAARVYGANQFATLRRVVVPAAAPSIYTGLRIAVSNGWMALVGAELVVGKVGLGFMISQGQENASVSTIFVGLITIGLLGVLIDTIIVRSEHFVLPWRRNVVANNTSA